ncbi:tetratricopeptide repeat protein [Candidatus Methylobacter oryzae]|uniref:Tetratricopeptide repeat protein n=1 Tax=Candidatus Methylobacter oryzae TaxID=2497749 RepID=A0ABY3CGL3_9GAMM|nr:tetratricopeptide repeat protein [Candidatus Methylobacter oryzae]TRX03025.1 tetratricopeptide repeat protein [Candidatus Methylobacter oryzae]
MAVDLSSKKVLIIEDQAPMRDAIKQIVGSLGARFIVTEESGSNAIVAMRNHKFDIVLCDYNLLGEKTGQQVLEEARYLKLLPLSSIFIMATGEHRLELVLSAVDNKPDEYLIKPFSAKQLSSRIEKCQVRKDYLACVENEIDKGNLYQAIHQCEKLLRQDDKKMHMQLLKMQAELLVKVGDLNKAEQIYLDVKQQREFPWAKLGLGVVAFHRGDYVRAIKILDEVIEQHPMMLEAYDLLAKSYELIGDDEQALSSVNSAVELSPRSILRQKKLAVLADKTDNLFIAKKAYMATIKLGKNSIHKSPTDYSGLANIYLKTDFSDKALQVVRELNQQFHNDPEAMIRSALLEADIYQTKGHMELALQAQEKAFKLNKQFNKQLSRELRMEMVRECYLSGDTETSNEMLNDLVTANIDDKLFIKDLLTMCGDFVGDNHAEILVQKVKRDLVNINNKGVSLFQEGNIRKAIALFEKALTLMPDNHTIILNLVKTLIYEMKTSKPDQEKVMHAQSYINKAIQLGIPHNKVSVIQTELDAILSTIN